VGENRSSNYWNQIFEHNILMYQQIVDILANLTWLKGTTIVSKS
jgi:hypothetical protein